MAQRHDGVRNLLTSFLGKVCTNVEVEPQLLPLYNERRIEPQKRSDKSEGKTGHD